MIRIEIIYSAKVTSLEPNNFTIETMKKVFSEAIKINQTLIATQKKVAYFFIDPLLDSFEAANKFYFNILECESISKINTYKSGASPIQALTDAKELIDNKLYDAVFIFGYEPLITNKCKYGKDEIQKAMKIFEDKSLIECYNLIAHQLCKEIGLTKDEFLEISDKLYQNYLKTIQGTQGDDFSATQGDGDGSSVLIDPEIKPDRGRLLTDLNGDLLRLTDCANPNIDFAGGVILSNETTAESLQIEKSKRMKVASAAYRVVQGLPENISTIVGRKDNIFPHLREAIINAQNEARINLREELKNDNLTLEVYTCYPPIPLAFLLAAGIVKDKGDILDFLDRYELTITGGLNLARAPWINPALNGLIEMHDKMSKDSVKFGLVHGNGGIGEVQGVAILQKN